MPEDCFSMNEVTELQPEIRREMMLEMMAVPTQSMHEDLMVHWLTAYAVDHGYVVSTDRYNNVYITKGKAEFYPCVASHIDTVQPLREIEVKEEGGYVTGWLGDRRVGFGADCKTGIYVCLELLRLMPNLKVLFCASEEIGAEGARRSDPECSRMSATLWSLIVRRGISCPTPRAERSSSTIMERSSRTHSRCSRNMVWSGSATRLLT